MKMIVIREKPDLIRKIAWSYVKGNVDWSLMIIFLRFPLRGPTV